MEIRGHNKVWDKLKNLADKTSLSLAFSGKEGVGKKLVALSFFKEIFGLASIEEVKNYPDVMMIYPEDKVIKTDKIREAIRFSGIKSYHGGKKAILIDDFHLTNINGQNAILKLLEEPPLGEIIILITSDYETLLPTIRSRLINIEFDRLGIDDLSLIAKDQGLEASKEFLQMAEGSAEKLIQLCECDESLMKKFAYSYILDLGDGFLQARELPYMEFSLASYYTCRILNDLLSNLIYGKTLYSLSEDLLSKRDFELSLIIEKIKKLDRARSLYGGNYNKKLILTELFFT